LAAFSKYPREAGEDLRVEGRAGTKKHGFFQSEKEIFQTVASETGLEEIKSAEGGLAWARHPLAYLVEAADDICYSILDIEDGVRLGYVQSKSAMEVLVRIAGKSPRFSDDRLKQFEDPRARVGYLRAMAVGQLVDEFKQAFLDAESAILENKFDGTLGDVIASAEHLKGLRDVARTTCYSAAPVVEIELAGYEALAGLLECFVPSFMCADESCTVRDKKVRSLLDTYSVVHDVGSPYGQALRITDFVSGMTDRYALTAYRRLKGIALPGYLR
jgi:dGTPase